MFEFEAIGTHWKIDIDQDLLAENRAGLLHQIETRIAAFDKNYSRFRPDSLVMEMAKKAGTYELPSDAKPMMDLYERLYKITNGAFTPLIGQLLVDAGYDDKYTLIPGELHTPPTWDKTLEYQFPKVELKKPALLDFGALGKGYLIEIVGEILEQNRIRDYCIDAGGDIQYRNTSNKPLRIGLEHPNNFEQVIGVATLTNRSICGSAGNRRAWDRFHHIMDPHTLESPRHITCAWTVADSTLIADAMATCLFFVPAEQLLKYYKFEYLFLKPDMTFQASKNFPGEIFLTC